MDPISSNMGQPIFVTTQIEKMAAKSIIVIINTARTMIKRGSAADIDTAKLAIDRGLISFIAEGDSPTYDYLKTFFEKNPNKHEQLAKFVLRAAKVLEEAGLETTKLVSPDLGECSSKILPSFINELYESEIMLINAIKEKPADINNGQIAQIGRAGKKIKNIAKKRAASEAVEGLFFRLWRGIKNFGKKALKKIKP